jgi:protocatechuate 3,4-dioxygenase beta subunit
MPTKKTAVKETLKLTPAVEEGPYYKDGSPERKAIITKPDTPGTKLIIEGCVLDENGKPIAKAWLDFWHADGTGQYDNKGYNLRGHQYTDKDGHYHLETVRPVQYLFRALHVHVKVQANDSAPVLTTQLFFPGEKRNTTDPIFEKGTLMEVKDVADGQLATFYFVVET